MDIILIVAVIAGLIYMFFGSSDSQDEDIARRMQEFSSTTNKKKKIKALDDDKDIDTNTFLKKSIENVAKNITEKSKTINEQKQLLAQAGFTSDDDALLKHTSKKVTYAALLGGFGFFMLFGGNTPILLKTIMLVLAPAIGFRLPDMMLKSKSKYRADEVTYTLPDSIDLLSVCVEAGLGLDSAISRVAAEQKNTSPILSEEFNKVSKDILAGVPRADAFRNMLKRNGSLELKSFVGLLIQSDKLGTSIAQSLKVYSDALRIKRRQKAEQLAAQAGVKMSLPLVLFVLPATFIVILAPAAITMISIFMGSDVAAP